MINGFTCGAFDLCHAGHMLMFKECRAQCDYLIVALQEDPSVTDAEYRGKKKNKPIMSLEERLIILEGIKYIDEIVFYKTEEDLLALLRKLDIGVRFLGADWEGKEFTGHDLDMKVVFNSRDHGFSTSELRHRVHLAEQERLTEMVIQV